MVRHRLDTASSRGRQHGALAAVRVTGLAVLLAGISLAGLRLSGALPGGGAAAGLAVPGTGPAAGPGRAGHAADPVPREPARSAGAAIPLRVAAPVPVPPRMEPAAWHQVPGSSVTAVGDSIMVASTPALQQALPGIDINAVVGRQFSTGLQVIASLASAGQLRPVVVVGLGTNGPVSAGEISQLLAEVGPRRILVLVNTFAARPWEAEVNSVLAATARSRPRVVLANWYGTIEHRSYLLLDGIHPTPPGGILYARMLAAVVQQAGNLPG